jgi:hypothetical protein
LRAVSAAFSPLMSAMTICAPSATRRSAQARPMPLAPPVTMTTDPLCLVVSMMTLLCR